MILEINGIEANVAGPIAFTWKGPTLATLRNGAAHSNRVTLPYDDGPNDRACGQLRQPAAPVSATSLPCRVLEGGVDLLDGSGRAYIREGGRSGYEVDIVGGAFAFLETCKNTPLADVPGWSAYDFFYTNTDITPRAVAGTDIAFPLTDFGRQQTIGSYTVVDNSGNVVAYPSFRLKAIVTQIVEGLGYTLVNEPDDQTWLVAALPFNKSICVNGPRYIDANSDSYTKTAVTLSSVSDAIATGPTQYRYIHLGTLENVDLDIYAVDTISSIDAHTLSVSSGSMTVYNLELVALPFGIAPGGGSPIATRVVASGPATGTINFPAIIAEFVTSVQLNASTGVELYLQLRLVAGTAAVISYSIPLLSGSGTLTPRAIVNRTGFKCTPEALLPDISCAELLKMALVQYGAFIGVDERKKEVSIVQATQIDLAQGGAKDWGKKLAMKPPYPVGVDYQGFSSTNWLRFSADEDVAKQLGDGSFATNAGDGQSKTYLQTPFTPSKRVRIINLNVDCAQVLHWQQSTDGASWQEYSTNTVRLLVLNTLALARNYLVFSTTTSKATPVVGMLTDIYLSGGGDATLSYAAANAYAPIQRWANQGRRFDVDMLLSPADIQGLSQMQTIAGYTIPGILVPVHVPQLNGTFLIESVGQWSSQEIPVSVTLIKIG